MIALRALALAALLMIPLARADGPTEIVDLAYDEATATLDHHYAAASARADDEAAWSDDASHAAAGDTLAGCGNAESAYAARTEARAEENASATQARGADAVAFAGRVARGEDPFGENGTVSNETTAAGEWIDEQLQNGTIVRAIIEADGPIRSDAIELALLASDTILRTVPCYALDRDPTLDGRRVLLREDAPLILRHVDGALEHALPGAPSAGDRYAIVLEGIDRVANATGIDPYAPLPPVDTELLDEAWNEACPTIALVWPCTPAEELE